MNTMEQIHQEDLERLKSLRYMEDMRNEAAQKAVLDNTKETA